MNRSDFFAPAQPSWGQRGTVPGTSNGREGEHPLNHSLTRARSPSSSRAASRASVVRPFLALFSLGPLALAVACTARSSPAPPTTADTLPVACNSYLTSYRECMVRLGREPRAVDERIAATRDALAASQDAGAIATRCVASMKQLQTSCF
jgi:hypothetical protein